MFETISTNSNKTSDDNKNTKSSPKKSAILVKKQSDIRSMFSKLTNSPNISSVSQGINNFIAMNNYWK